MAEIDFTTEDYIWQLANDKDFDVRRNAAFRLGRERDERVVQPLLNAINDENESVRVRVVEALGTRDEKVVIQPVIKALQNDDNSDVRRIAARSLGYIGDEQGLEPLIDALCDTAPEVRAQAAESLETFKQQSAAQALITAFLQDEDSNVIHFAKQSLSNLGSTDVVDALLIALENHKKPELLADIIEVLAQIKDTRALNPIEAYVGHKDDGVASMAEWAISILKKAN